MAALAHLAVRRTGGGGHESDLPAGRDNDASGASQEGVLEEMDSKALSVRRVRRECGWSHSNLWKEVRKLIPVKLSKFEQRVKN